MPVLPFGGAPVIITGLMMEIAKAFEGFDTPEASEIRTVRFEKEPSLVGDPWMIPLEVEKVRPAGSVPVSW